MGSFVFLSEEFNINMNSASSAKWCLPILAHAELRQFLCQGLKGARFNSFLGVLLSQSSRVAEHYQRPTDVHQMVPFEYKWARGKYLARCANH